MLKYEQALKVVLEATDVLASEKVSIEDSIGRVLKEDIYSNIEMPPFDKAAMDGYALNSKELGVIPAKLKSIGTIQAGEVFKKKLKAGECVKIMTGAPLPRDADSVVMVENTRQLGDSVEVLKAVKKGENVCFQAEVLKRRQKVLTEGTKISSSHIGILATVGRKFIKVFAKPKVAILNTGAELVPVGARLGKNKIYNTNGPMLTALLKQEAITPCFLGIAKDNRKELTQAMKKGFDADVLLISGAVSMGDYDLVPDVLGTMGVKKLFHRVNIKPGKPLFFGKKNKTLVFGIPGNPVSNFLAYLIFIQPVLSKMMGCNYCKPLFKEGICKTDEHLRNERKHFVLVKIEKKKEDYQLIPIPSHGSADTVSLSQADGFMLVDEGVAITKKSSKRQFITWKII